MLGVLHKLFANFYTWIISSVISTVIFSNYFPLVSNIRWLLHTQLIFLIQKIHWFCIATSWALQMLFLLFLCWFLTTAVPTYFALWQSRCCYKFVEILSIKTMQIWRRMLLKLRELPQLSSNYLLWFFTARRQPIWCHSIG